MSRALALAFAGLLLLAARSARASPTSRLVYSRTADAASCPDEEALRHAVAARVGYDPFFAWAKRTVVVTVARRDDGFVAQVDLVDEQGIAHGARELRIQGGCAELLDAAALAIAIAVDPQSILTPEKKVTPAPAPAPPPPARAVPVPGDPLADDWEHEPDTSPAPVGESAAVELEAGGIASAGAAPAPAVGFGVGAALRWRRVSIGLEGLVDAPATAAAVGGGRVSSWLALGAIVPCGYLGPAFLCAEAQVGSMQSSSQGVTDTRNAVAPWVAMGGRLGALLAIGKDTALRIRTDVLANLMRMTLQLNGIDAWSAPAVATSLGLDFVLRFR